MTVTKNRLFLATANQRRERLNFTSEKTSFAASDWTKDVFSLVKSDRTGNYVILGAKTGKPPFFKMSERFVDAGQENKATV